MPARISSLAAELAELGNVTPCDDELDSDPEALDAGKRQGDDDDDEEDEEDIARNHARHNMVHVEPSKMRKQANFIESMDDETLNKYQGVKATRKEMMEEDDESDDDEEEDQSDLDDEELEEGDEEDIDDSEEDGEEEDDEEKEDESMDESIGDMSEGEGDRTAEPKGTGKKLRFAEDVKDTRQTPKENGKKSAVQNDATLLAELKQRSSEDAARGRDARKQIDAWGKLLGTRIRAQKVVRSAGRISTRAMTRYISDLEDGDEMSTLEDSLDALDQLSSHLFKAQQSIFSSYASTSESGSTLEALEGLQSQIEKQTRPSSRKRKVEEDDHLNDQIALLMKMHEDVYSPMWKDVLSKWSWRTSNATMEDKRKAKSKFDSSSAVGSSNGLKAIEQSAEEQIQRGMTGEAFERLRKRTRVWRGTDNESRIDIDNAEGSDDEEDDSTNNAANAENVDVFDDSDFYAALLRELIDNKGGLSTTDAEGSAASASWAQAAKRAAKKHRVVDRNASKGRRLRFDVHEKVQSFMPPIPSETWSVEQIDRLMRQLRNTYGSGKIDSADGEEADNHADEDDVVKAPAEVALDGLRLFG